MGSLWVCSTLPSGSLHTFTFHQLMPLSPKPSILYWLGSRINVSESAPGFGLFPLHWALSCCQNNLFKTKICSCFLLAVNLSLVFISYRIESLILREIFSSLYSGSIFPFPVSSPATPLVNTPCSSPLPVLASCFTQAVSLTQNTSHTPTRKSLHNLLDQIQSPPSVKTSSTPQPELFTFPHLPVVLWLCLYCHICNTLI